MQGWLPQRRHFVTSNELAEFLRTRLAAEACATTKAALGRVDVLYEYPRATKHGHRTGGSTMSISCWTNSKTSSVEPRGRAARRLSCCRAMGRACRAYLWATSTSRHPSARRRTTLEEASCGRANRDGRRYDSTSASLLLKQCCSGPCRRRTLRVPSPVSMADCLELAGRD